MYYKFWLSPNSLISKRICEPVHFWEELTEHSENPITVRQPFRDTACKDVSTFGELRKSVSSKMRLLQGSHVLLKLSELVSIAVIAL